MLKALLARVDPDFSLGIAYRLFRLMGTHVNGLDDRDALPYVVLSHDYDSWIFPPYMNPDPIATLGSPVVVGSAQRDSGNQVIPLLTLPDEILVTILNLGVAASFYRDFAKPYWAVSRIRLPDGTLLDRQTTNKDTFETALAKVHPWKWVSSCIKSDSSWNKHRVMMAFYRIVPFLQNMVDEQGDWVWPVRGSRFFFAILEILEQKDLKFNRWKPERYGYQIALGWSVRRNLLPLSKWMVANGALGGGVSLWNPLLYAARSGSIDVVQWVIQERIFVTYNAEPSGMPSFNFPVDEALRLNHHEIADYIFKVAQSEPALSYVLTNNAIVFHGMGNDDPQLLERWLQDNRSPSEQCLVARDAGACLNFPVTRMLYENGVNLSTFSVLLVSHRRKKLPPAMNTAAATNPRPPSAQIIDDAMQQKLNIDKVQLRVENEHYLRAHPEIRHILDFFVNEVLVQQPTNLQEFAAGLFSDVKLQAKVEQHTVESRQLQDDMADMNDF
ncbi:hypothetical protein BDZ88DRAFT_505533 [Geranomyces variabilis]|nr:hypothetical protein BDZ88DRAFT_505533 [Geranomyces variabilis]KAJ3133878.1 RIIa domain-containing protein 1 [Geranomyces variabilis]